MSFGAHCGISGCTAKHKPTLLGAEGDCIISPAKTASERKADERQRHKEAGRTAVTVHVRPEYVPEVRALEAKLQRRENRKRGPAP